jgi:putative membrane protein
VRVTSALAKTSKGKREHILVLCVDRDDDLGVKAGVKTPLVGRKETVDAALSLVLRDPEEPDANAMFEAVRIYDRLKEGSKEQEECQVAAIAGSELGGVGADRKLVSELTEVLKTFPASDVVLVTDGYTDEAVLPLIESRVPVTSVRRIVVKHSESIEQTAAIFSRYLRMLWENPRYSRIALGLPGILLVILGVLAFAGALYATGIAFLIVFGAFLFVRGFGLDKVARRFYRGVREFSPPPLRVQMVGFSAATGLLLIAIGCYQGAFTVNTAINILPSFPQNLGEWLALLPRLIGYFLSQSVALIVIGICVMLSGRAIRWYLERDPRVLRTVAIALVAVWSSQVLSQTSLILMDPSLSYTDLVISIVIGVILTVVAILITSLSRRKFAAFFKKRKEEIEELQEG